MKTENGPRPQAMLGLVLLVVVYAGLGTVYVRSERPNQDEGWYLLGARLVRAHQRPYVDFAYVQPPLMPYVYAALGADRSLQAGRRVSLGFGCLTVLLVGLAGWRLGAAGGLLAAALLALTPFAISQQSIVKTYALANACTALGLLAAVHAKNRPPWAVAAGLGFALAALVRNSAVTALFGWWVWLALDRDRRKLLPIGLAAGLVPIAALYAPLAGANFALVKWNIVGHHAAHAASHDPVVLLVSAFTLAVMMAKAAPALAGLLVGGLALQRPRVPADDDGLPEVELAFLVTVFVALSQLVTEHPYQEYQALTMPSAALLAGLCWARLLARLPQRRQVGLALAVVVVGVAAVKLPASIGRLPGERLGPLGIHGPLRRVAALVDQLSAPGEPIFTFQTDVAIEAHRPLTPGLTLASFSFVEDAVADRYHLLGPRRLLDQLRRRAPALLVLSDGDLSHIFRAAPAPEGYVVDPQLDPAAKAIYGPIVDALDRGYTLAGRVEGVGQFKETFTILKRR